MPTIILHHYASSNFSEKIRLVLGHKHLSWASITIPQIAPKPDFEPLTGGFRRTPALQIGADIYCDTAMIALELERRYPEPTLFPGPWPERSRASALALAAWAEDKLLWPIALYITGTHADGYPDAFHRDRARLHGKPIPRVEQVKRAAARRLPEVERLLARVEALIPTDTPYLEGGTPALSDMTLYHPLWFLERIGGPSKLLSKLPRVRGWMARIAEIGEGRPREQAPAWALEQASQGECAPLSELGQWRFESGLDAGMRVTVKATTEAAEAEGTLVHLDDERVVIRHHNERVGDVHVHFPREGYAVRPR